MYTLGVNGWVNGAHDPAASLFRDGELVAAAEEERFSRRKHAFDQIPFSAVEYCLAVGGITAAEVDNLAVGWDIDLLLSHAARTSVRGGDEIALDVFLPLRLFPERRGRKIDVFRVNHHVAHAAFAFAASAFEEAAVLVADGSGEYASTSIARARRGRPVEILRSYPFSESVGIFYEALTSFIGFGGFQEGRTMGLAAYGSPTYDFDGEIDLDSAPPDPRQPGDEKDVVEDWHRRFEKITRRGPFGAQRVYVPASATARPELDLCAIQKDLAASGQAWTERQMARLARHAVLLCGSRNLVLGGGVALNCPANQAVSSLPEVESVFVPPAPGDAGVALGAACAALAECGIIVRLNRGHVYRGPSFSTEAIAAELARTGACFRESADVDRDIARAIAQGQVVALFLGGMELGPRALCHRSIIADPRSTAIRDRVNRIKGREAWRPLAPSVRADLSEEWFEPVDSPFMSFSARARGRASEQTPGVVHHDGTARLQTVNAEDEPRVAALLGAVEAEIGVPMVLNTSFNIGAEPIVCSPLDALRSFHGSELDVLFIDRFKVLKDRHLR